MTMEKRVLGKGLDALIGSFSDVQEQDILIIDIEDIEPMATQPRKRFDSEGIKRLADSISKYGILQPLIVKQENEKYKIIAGERRWRAAKLSELKEVPVIVKDNVDDITVFEISLIENLQREDLNPIEEAESYKKLIEAFNYTHEKLAELIGKNRTYVTNSLRLLKLSRFVREKLIEGVLTTGHGKVLASLPEEEQVYYAKVVISKELSVRELESVLSQKNGKKKRDKTTIDFKNESSLISEKFKTKVEIKMNSKEKGKIILHFKNKEELDNLIKELTC
jgi:ParB family chromosome partitioning protein